MGTWNDTDHIDPGGRWLHWKLRGNFLISPDGDRITPERLSGLLFRESLERRRAKTLARHAKVIVLADRFRAQVEALSGGG